MAPTGLPTSPDDRSGAPGGGWFYWLLALAPPLLAVALSHLVFTPHWLGNDDAGMNLIAAGVSLSSRPSPYLLFVHPLTGQLLSQLYTSAPAIPWYAIFMQGAACLAGAVLCRALLLRKPAVLQAALGLAFCMPFLLAALVVLQFTLSAALCMQAALAWWWANREKTWLSFRLPVLLSLVALGVLLRGESTMMALVFAAPLALIDLWESPPASEQLTLRARLSSWLARVALPFLCVAGTIGLLEKHRAWFYASSPGWSDFHAYNRLRGQFTDFWRDSAEVSPAVLEQAGWSRNDYELIRRFYFCDREVYSSEKLRLVVGTRKPPSFSLEAVRAAFLRAQDNPLSRLLALAALLPYFLLPWRRLPAGALVICAAGAAFLAVTGQGHYCPPHFVQGMLGFLAVAGLLLCDPTPNSRFRMGLLAAVGLALLCTTAFLWKGLRARSRAMRAASAAWHKELRGMNPDPAKLYVVWGGCLRIDLLLPFDSLDDLRPINVFPLSCLTNTPIAEERLREFGASEPIDSLASGDKVQLISDLPSNELLVRRFAERRNLLVKTEAVGAWPTASAPVTVQVWRLRVIGPASTAQK